MFRLSLHIVLLLLLIPTSSYSSTNSYTGRVIDVTDGDTITILTQNQEKIEIRLAGIDCPEGSQIHGKNAKQFISSLVSERRVRIIPDTIDQYGRTVATLLINGENVNRQIIAFGHGWVYRKYCTADYCNDWCQWQTKTVPKMAMKSVPPPQAAYLPFQGGDRHDQRGGMYGHLVIASPRDELPGHCQKARHSS
jgi:hypothetical protein